MTYDELADNLEREGMEESPEEIHGLLCGRLAGGETLDREQLLLTLIENLDSEEELVVNGLPFLAAFYQEIGLALGDGDFSFQLLLPVDQADLTLRVAALSIWCRGFLSGFGDSGIAGRTQLSEEVIEALEDLAAIGQAGFEGLAEEDDEADFFRLTEYARMAVLLIFSECHGNQRDAHSTPRQLH